jgi:DNA ligase (NAD+)
MNAQEIVTKLKEASLAYYNTGATIMTDADYDALRDQLKAVDPENAYLKVVGAPAIGETFPHTHPMGSQEKLKDHKEFKDWVGKMLAETDNSRPFVGDLKLDGITVALYYKDGVMIRALTRGDGFKGEDITSNVLKMKNVKKQLPGGFTGVLRAECMLSISDFKKYFEPLDYKNPRNSVSGISRDKKGSPLLKHLKPVYFNALSEDQDLGAYQNDRLELLKSWGLEVVDQVVFKLPLEGGPLDALWNWYKEIETKRATLDYEIDGVIFKVNACADNDRLGMSSDLRPKGERCVKFAAQGTVTKLLSVELSIGHTGAIIPTGKVAPVNIGGVTVSSVLLNNYEDIERLGIAINDDVSIIRAGDVIPKIIGQVKAAADRVPIVPPTECMYCAGALVKEGAHIFCKNDLCEGKGMRRVKTYISKREIKFIGDELLQELYENHNVKEPQDLYKLTVEYLRNVPRGNGRVGSMAEQIMVELEKSKQCPLMDLIGSLAIPLLGRRQAEIMIGGGINSLEKFVTLTTPDQLSAIPGFSIDGKKAPIIIEGIKKARKTIKALLDAGVTILDDGVQPEFKLEQKTGPHADKIICFTGCRPTPDEQKGFVALGGTVKDGMSKVVTHLVVRDLATASNKAQKAKENGTLLVAYADFQQWLKG